MTSSVALCGFMNYSTTTTMLEQFFTPDNMDSYEYNKKNPAVAWQYVKHCLSWIYMYYWHAAVSVCLSIYGRRWRSIYHDVSI